MAGTTWSDAELEAAIRTYLTMVALEDAGTPFVKRQMMRELLTGPLAGRSTAEQRMQNISALMIERGRPWVKGYKPLANIGTSSKLRMLALLDRVLDERERPSPNLKAAAAHWNTPAPSHSIRVGIMHMRRAPAETYLFSLEGATQVAFKAGWAFDSGRRLRDFNHAAMPGLGGILYASAQTRRWRLSSRFAWSRACLPAFHRPGTPPTKRCSSECRLPRSLKRGMKSRRASCVRSRPPVIDPPSLLHSARRHRPDLQHHPL